MAIEGELYDLVLVADRIRGCCESVIIQYED